MTELSARLDYLRATTMDTIAIKAATEGYFSDDTTTDAIPLYGYKHALKHSISGAVYLFGGHTPTMGNCQQFSGTAITSLMETFSQPSCPALHYVCDDRWKVTRLDIAIDSHNPELRPRHVYAALDRAKKKTIWRTWREVANKDLDSGHTVYGGGVESDKRIRIYDKAAESGTEGVWTRYEMVFSGARAAEVWDMVKDCKSDLALLGVSLGLMANMLDFPDWREWQREFGSTTEIVWWEVPRVESDTWRWLMSQVAPTFVVAREKEGNWALLDRFIAELRGRMD